MIQISTLLKGLIRWLLLCQYSLRWSLRAPAEYQIYSQFWQDSKESSSERIDIVKTVVSIQGGNSRLLDFESSEVTFSDFELLLAYFELLQVTFCHFNGTFRYFRVLFETSSYLRILQITWIYSMVLSTTFLKFSALITWIISQLWSFSVLTMNLRHSLFQNKRLHRMQHALSTTFKQFRLLGVSTLLCPFYQYGRVILLMTWKQGIEWIHEWSRKPSWFIKKKTNKILAVSTAG